MFPPIVARERRLFAADGAFAQSTASRLQAVIDICTNWSDGAGMPQGYTYLGQFLAHEIVSRELPRTPTSDRSRRLDLDSLYGPGARFDEHGCFLYTEGSAEHTQDLLRDPATKAPGIPEFRNDQHPIISQLHLTIQLFHNAVMRALGISEQGRQLGARERFETAREYVTATVQRIYAEDYLAECSDPAIYDLHKNGLLKAFEVPASEAQLPFEITHATMRFGHSQVRDAYLLNERETHTTLDELFSFSGALRGPGFRGIPRDKAVDWRRFFRWDGDDRGIKPDSGRRINPKVAGGMSTLPEPPTPDVIVRNIEAGIRAELPSGQTIAKSLEKMRIDHRIGPELRLQPSDAAHERALREAGLWSATPLWLHVLIEASALGGDGLRLGPLGSVFLCETIRSALEGQRNYRDVQASCAERFGFARIGTFVGLAKLAEPQIDGRSIQRSQ